MTQETLKEIPLVDGKTSFSHFLQSLSKNECSKACLFNLIIYTYDSKRTAYFSEIVKIIKGQFPCRIIFVQGNPLGKNSELSIRTTPPEKNHKGFSSDQIFIEASGQSFDQIYFLFFPLLVPDLPIFLLWGENPTTEYSLLPRLETFSTRLIFDAETTEDLQQFARDMLMRLNSSSLQVSDMNWAKIAGWREVFAQTFDSPERMEQLSSAHLINIIYNDNHSEQLLHPNIQALYLQAYLAARLGWQLIKVQKGQSFPLTMNKELDEANISEVQSETKGDSLILTYQCKQMVRKVVLFHQRNERFEPEDILSIEIQGENGYACHISRMSPTQIKVQASNQFQCELPLRFLIPTLLSGRSFVQEIFYQKMSEHYVQMLEKLCSVKWNY